MTSGSDHHCEECKRRGRVAYVREEVLVAAFVAALSSVRIDEKVLALAAGQVRFYEPGVASALELGELLDIFRKTDDPVRRRRFVEALHSNSSWKDGVISIEPGQPDEIAAQSREAG